MSFLLGFPAGLGLTAQNLWRLGRRGLAAIHLALAPVSLAGLLLVALWTGVDSRLVLGPANLAFVAYVAWRASRDQAAADAHGRQVVLPGKLRGAAAIIGGWIVAYLAIVPLITLIFIGGQVASILGGTVETGSSGTACSTTGTQTTFQPGATVYIVAHFRHTVEAGHTAHLTITAPDGTATSMDTPITSSATCANTRFETSTESTGVYRVDLSVDGEQLAAGTFAVVGATGTAQGARPTATATPEPTVASPSPRANPPTASPSPIGPSTPRHDAPDLEARLPTSVAGENLTSESYRGTALLQGLYGASDSDIAAIEASLRASGHTVDDLALAVGGRASLKDRPYFVNAFELKGVAAADLEKVLGVPGTSIMVDHPDAGAFKSVVIGGKHVLRGTLAMIDQTEHARGMPYVYLWKDVTFEVVTDDPAWAAAALKALP